MNDQDTIWDLEEALDQMTKQRDEAQAEREVYREAMMNADAECNKAWAYARVLREALAKIANQNSGVWGQIARNALDNASEGSTESTSDTSASAGHANGS